VLLNLVLLQSSPVAGGSALLGFLPLILMFAIFFFLVIMPTQRQKKQTAKMLSELQNGNVIQTSGGIVGTIITINANDDTLVIRVKPDNIKLQVARSAVAGLIAEK
jgi:preprotein translocase subunit YajC